MARSWKQSSFLGLLIGLAGIAAPTAFVPEARAQQATAAPNVYRLEISLAREGKVIATPKMTVLFGKQARLTLVEKGGADGSMRIQVTATPADKTAAGVSTVKLDAIVLEQIAGAWVVAAEPSIRAAEGKAAAMQVQGGLGAMQITISATPEFSEKALTAQPKLCGA